MRSLLLLPFLLGFSVPAIAHNEANGGCGSHCEENQFESSKDEVPCTFKTWKNVLNCDPFVVN